MPEGGLDLVTSPVERRPGDPGAIPDVVAALHGFAGDLHGALPANDNLVVSPYSVAVALGMTLAGASGTTAQEIRAVLRADDRFHAGLSALTAHVEGLAGRLERARGTTSEIALDTANQLFGQRGVRWEQEFLDVLAGEYGAGMRTVDFESAAEDARVLINAWVEERTHDRIADLIPEGVLDVLTRLVLVNAIYLKAPWEEPFTRHRTAPRPFRRLDGSTIDVDTMVGGVFGRLSAGDGWSAARLPYAGGRLAMTVVLPDAGRFADVDAAVGDGALPELLAEGRPTHLDVRLPRWTTRTGVELGAVLAGLGMPTAFNAATADFRSMTEDDLDLSIGAVRHQGFIAVDEDGTEAAAATAVAMRTTAMPVTQPFHVDRPFLHVVHDVDHGTPLFLGRVLDPSA